MRKPIRILFTASLLSLMTVMGACHSSKKTVKGSSGVPVRTVDYNEMRAELKARHFDVPMIGELIAEVTKWVGVPYKYAGNDKKGVDCSGLTSQVFLKVLGIKMPRSSREQQQWCRSVKKENLQPGDLIFFATGSNRDRVSHVGMYVGNGEMIHASSSRGVIVSNLDERYYLTRYHSAGRPEVIEQLYASADKKGKKSKEKKGKNSSYEETPVAPEIILVDDTNPAISSGAAAAVRPMTISVDDLIEMQVDSIANAMTRQSVKPEEPNDSTFTQFFD